MLPVVEGISRNELGKGSASKWRRKGYVPGVVYNEGQNRFVNLSNDQMRSVLKSFGDNSLLELKVGADSTTVLIKEVQRHPISGELLHIDFKPVSVDKVIRSRVPVTFYNTDTIKRQGGIVQTQKNEVEIECQAKDVPRHLNIDASKYNVGESMKIKDIEIAQEISILGNPEDVIACFVSARGEM